VKSGFCHVPSHFNWPLPNSMGYRTIILAFLVRYTMQTMC